MFNKGQISQTMTWVVATIIIIIILVASYFIAHGDLISTDPSLPDKQKDFVGTKSIDNFMSENNRLQLVRDAVNGGDYSEFDEFFRPVLENLYSEFCSLGCRYDGSWNVRVSKKGSPLSEHALYLFDLGDENKYYHEILIDNGDGKIKLEFWKSEGWINY